MFVGLGVGVDPDYLGRRAGEHVRAVPLSACEVRHPKTAAALCDPLVDREVAAEPVVLGWEVGERSLPGQLERGHAGGLVVLHVAHVSGGSCTGTGHYSSRVPGSPQATVARIKDANVRYHDAAAASHDAKWGIDVGPTGQAQVRACLLYTSDAADDLLCVD